MFDAYEFYQGVVLRDIILGSDFGTTVRSFEKEGRISAFVVSGRAGVFVKHSAKRMAPWRFSFTLDQISTLLDLEAKYFDTFMVFVCGRDGLVTIDAASLHQIVGFEDKDNAWVGIDRKRNSQYTVWGNRAELSNKVPHGTAVIHETLRERARELSRGLTARIR